MKFARYMDNQDTEQLGVLQSRDGSEVLVNVTDAAGGTDLTPIIKRGEPAYAELEAAAKSSSAVSTLDSVTFLSPFARPRNVVAIGANYRAHVEEIDLDHPDKDVAQVGRNLAQGTYPPAFAKLHSSISAHNAPVVYPKGFQKIDYEGELAFVVSNTPEAALDGDWRDAVAGFTIANDVSARDVQLTEMKRGMLLLGKNFPGFTPIGPYFVTADEIPDPEDVKMETRVNGEVRQSANSGLMIYSFKAIITYYLAFGLKAGDIFLTGSPAGVAIGMPDPEKYYLKPGDVMEVEMAGLGILRNEIVAAD